MDAKAALQRLTYRAQMIIEADEEARAQLAEKLAKAPATSLDMEIDSTLLASAIAKPWRELLLGIERHGVREALAKQREEITDRLLRRGMSTSTNLVTNAARFHELEGMRRFLSETETTEIDDDTPAEEAAPQPTEEPVAAPAPKTAAPKVTAAQKRTLQSIKEAGVTLQETSIREGVRVDTRPGHARPRRDMVEYVIQQGWAKSDTSTSLYHGQAVSLTPAGEAILGG